MKFYKYIFIIIIVFFETGNVLSNNNLFDVNNIEVVKKGEISNEGLANQAIKKGFNKLTEKILLTDEKKDLSKLQFSEIKELVTYYQVSDKKDNNNNIEKINFNITFDKDKIHDLFYKRGISYSEISDKEIFILPILKKDNRIFIYNKNFFYDKWNEISEADLLEFILPLENIEIIQKVNLNKNNLLNLKLINLFTEYKEKNLALVLIEDNNLKEEKIYFKTKILGKNIVKNITIKKNNLNEEEFYNKIIAETKNEITNLVKSQNLIDIRVPSFLNAQLDITKKANLIELNSRLKKIDSIEGIYVQKFNNKSIFLRIKYLGKLEKIINQLENQKVILKFINDQWSIKFIK